VGGAVWMPAFSEDDHGRSPLPSRRSQPERFVQELTVTGTISTLKAPSLISVR
jgi:hypothetical protein